MKSNARKGPRVTLLLPRAGDGRCDKREAPRVTGETCNRLRTGVEGSGENMITERGESGDTSRDAADVKLERVGVRRSPVKGATW